MKEELSNSKMAVSAAGGPGEMKALLFTAERNVEVRDRPIPTIRPAGLKLARDLGADRVLGPDELTQDSYSVVLEFSGSADAARLSPLVVAPGGRIGFVGIVPALVNNFPVSPLVTKDVEVHGVLSGLAYWNKSLDLAAKGSLRPIQLLDRVFPYSEAPAAFEYLIRTDRSKPKLAISFEEQNTPADPD
jgi:threonine dehydrogenase-like Zn-dependent dehydrogenase